MKSALDITCADKVLTLSVPKIMGILNLTPDSFADGGRYHSKALALQRVAQMVSEGAHIIDIGAESSRPYAQFVSAQEELDRLMPVVIAVKDEFDIVLSIDTYKPQVMAEVIKAGVHMINDIFALQDTESLKAISESNVGVCLMHMQGKPQTMQDHPTYHDVVKEVGTFLEVRLRACIEAGISKDRIIIDPGFGFGKTTMHNMRLLRNLNRLASLDVPILVGLSRKASIGEILRAEVEDRLYGSLAAHLIAVMQGAKIVRTHDIKPTAQALQIIEAAMA